MIRQITLIAMCLICLTALAQEKADILVSYDAKSKGYESDTVKTTRMSLLANAQEAKYFNDLSLWSDSLGSTPEGKKQLSEIIMAACMSTSPDGGMVFDMRKGPVKRVYTYVFSDANTNLLTYFSKFGDEQCYYTEPLDEMQWEICDSTATISGYECTAAKSNYHGREWTAWFTTEIPIPFGPWKFHGLPGLILKAEADGGFEFTVTGIEHTDRVMTPMYSADTYQKTDRKKALDTEEYFVNNRESLIKAKYGNVQFNYNAADRKKYDASKYALEPDYKNR